jgi:hypothetical protein
MMHVAFGFVKLKLGLKRECWAFFCVLTRKIRTAPQALPGAAGFGTF